MGRVCSTYTRLHKASSLTVVDGFHGDTSRVFAVALLVQLHHGDVVVCLGRVQRVQFAHVRAKLLDCACAERVARRDEYAQSVLYQPETNLQEK